MSYVPHCTACKTTTNLLPKPYSKRKNELGEITSKGYRCRTCNTAKIRRYRQTRKGKANTYKANKKQTITNHAKVLARNKLNATIKDGIVTKPSACSKCQKQDKLDGHHNNYSEPLKVVWLCRGCHADLHRKLRVL